MVTEKVKANFHTCTLYCSEDKIFNKQFRVLATLTNCVKLIQIHIVRLFVMGKTPKLCTNCWLPSLFTNQELVFYF